MRPLTVSELDTFHRLGFHVFEGLFGTEECTALKADIDVLMADRAAKCERFICDYGVLGPLISEPRIMEIVAQVMGPEYAFHHLHAVRQNAGTPGVHWHQDYEQCPHTSRKHIMVHLLYYFNGLNGTIGDLLLVPSSHKTIIDNGALSFLGTENLPGTVVINNLPPGSAVLVHSALWHARRAQPGGEGAPRYFADASYCQSGILWPAYGRKQWREILQKATSLGLDDGGRYPHLFDETMFFDYLKARSVLEKAEGSLLLQVPGWEET